MRLTSSLLRKKLPLLATASATAALGLVAIVPLTAQAATPINGAHPYFMPWKLGTPLPAVPAGYTIEAMPNQAAWKGLAHGDQVPTTAVALSADTTAAAESAATTAATTQLASHANSAGYVNLEIIPAAYTCSPYTYTGDAGQHVAALNFASIKDAHDNMSYFYGSGQSSSLQAGISATGAAGSFSAAGTVSVSNFESQTFPYQIGLNNDYFRTFFDWSNFKQLCTDLHDGLPSYWNYFTQPTSWVLSANIYHVGTPAVPPVCGSEPATSKPAINTTTAKTIGGAFSVLGFSGSAQTGYDTNATITFWYGENGWLCGDKKYPTQGFDWPMAIP